MKSFLTILIFLTLGYAQAQQPIDTLINYITFENLKGTQKGYGLSAEQPIRSGAFTNLADRSALQIGMAKLENSFRWPDGSAIDFSKRASTRGNTGILDRYTLTHPANKTTVTLFVDPYRTDSVYYVPEGLTKINAASLLKETAPHLAKIEEIDAAENPYADQKTTINQEMSFIAAKVGIAALVDREYLRKVMTDTQASENLINHLFYSFVLHKFYALGKNISSSSEYAFNKMKLDFQKFHKQYPDINVGNIKINLN